MIVSVFRRFTIKVHRDLHSVQEKVCLRECHVWGNYKIKSQLLQVVLLVSVRTAQLFVAEGAKVVLVDLNEEGQAFAN